MAQGPVCCRDVLSEPGVWLRERSKGDAAGEYPGVFIGNVFAKLGSWGTNKIYYTGIIPIQQVKK